ncbi:MAG: hypothetical protein KDC53_23450, partial [Saprospiraceae bacterium]|nr:hypothetical protein [Saprospiraceae bacterium]
EADLSYQSLYGEIKVSWKVQGAQLMLDATIPANTRVSFWLPSEGQNILESGQIAKMSTDLEYVEDKDEYAIFNAGSGTYHFIMPWKNRLAAADLAAYTGTFQSDDGEKITIHAQGTQLLVDYGGQELVLDRVNNSDLFQRGETKLEFSKDKSGEINNLTLDYRFLVTKAKRIGN